MTKKPAFVLLAAIFPLLALLGWQRNTKTAASLATDGSVISVRIRFGVKDTKPTSWDGSLSVTGGEVLELRDWRPRADDRITGKNAWSLATTKGPNFVLRAWDEPRITGPIPYLLIPGIVADVKAAPGATVTCKTKQGAFSFKPHDVIAGHPLALAGGNVIVDRVATAQLKVSPPDYQSDFATILGGRTATCGPPGWRTNQADEVFARRFDGKAWGPAQGHREARRRLPGQDGTRPQRRRLGGLVRSRWMATWTSTAAASTARPWSPSERLTDDPQPDIYHNLATRFRTATCGWCGRDSATASPTSSRAATTAPAGRRRERVSTSPANDWEPAIAADSAGRRLRGLGHLRQRQLRRHDAPLRRRRMVRTDRRRRDAGNSRPTSAWPATGRTGCGRPGTRAASNGARIPASWSKQQGTRLYQWRIDGDGGLRMATGRSPPPT